MTNEKKYVIIYRCLIILKRKRDLMKKFIAISSAAVIVSGIAVSAYAASESNVTVTNSSGKNVTYQYSSGDETSKSISGLMTELDSLTVKKRTVSQVITIKSDNEDDMKVDMYLRLSADSNVRSTPTPSVDPSSSPEPVKSIEGTILDKYDIKITDASNDIVYSTELDGRYVYMNNNKYTEDLYIGRMNTQSDSETKVYTVTVTVPSGITASELSKLEDIDWSIVSRPTEETATPTPIATRRPTATPYIAATPAVAVSAETPLPLKTIPPVSTAVPEDTPEPEPTASPVVLKSGGVKRVGKSDDIQPGRYTATGSGMVRVYDSNGELKTSIRLKDDNDTSDNSGVSSYVLNLLEGETLEYEDRVNLKPYSTASAKATTRPTSTPRARATTRPASTPRATTRPTSTPRATAAKTNPKTGDTTPIAGLSVVGVFGLGLFAFTEIDRRKNKKND